MPHPRRSPPASSNPDADIAQDRIVGTTGAYSATHRWAARPPGSCKSPPSIPGTWGHQPMVVNTTPRGILRCHHLIGANATDNVGVAACNQLDSNPIAAEDTTALRRHLQHQHRRQRPPHRPSPATPPATPQHRRPSPSPSPTPVTPPHQWWPSPPRRERSPANITISANATDNVRG